MICSTPSPSQPARQRRCGVSCHSRLLPVEQPDVFRRAGHPLCLRERRPRARMPRAALQPLSQRAPDAASWRASDPASSPPRMPPGSWSTGEVLTLDPPASRYRMRDWCPIVKGSRPGKPQEEDLPVGYGPERAAGCRGRAEPAVNPSFDVGQHCLHHSRCCCYCRSTPYTPECALIVILGLIIVVAAAIVGVAAVAGNGGSTHGLAHGFSVLGLPRDRLHRHVVPLWHRGWGGCRGPAGPAAGRLAPHRPPRTRRPPRTQTIRVPVCPPAGQPPSRTSNR